MSKGKNLTFNGNIYGYCGPFVLLIKHTCITNSVREDRVDVLTGPAIDRLHEFEKLGLEPEEIKRQLNDYEELQCKEDEIEELQERNNYQRQTICKLVKEISRLSEQLDDARNKLGCIELVLKGGADENE